MPPYPTQCGRVVEDTAFSSDVMFTKGGDGEGEMVGQMVGASGEARGLGRYSGGRMWGSGVSDSVCVYVHALVWPCGMVIFG